MKVAFPSFLVALAACAGTAGEETESSSAPDVIDPTGTETMATLTVVLPPGAPSLSIAPQLQLDGVYFRLDEPSRRVEPGNHTLTLSFNTPKGAVSQSKTACARSRRTRTFRAGRCYRAVTEDDTTLPLTDFGFDPSIRNAVCPGVRGLLQPRSPVTKLEVFEWGSNVHCGSRLMTTITPATNCDSLATFSGGDVRTTRADGTTECLQQGYVAGGGPPQCKQWHAAFHPFSVGLSTDNESR